VTKEEYMELFREPQGRSRSFEGFSEYNEESSAQSFHTAVQQAAFAAANAARAEGRADPEWYEVTRVRILVGNPNVKVYGVTITSTGDSSGG
jgi:hypothetical protein